MDISSDGLPPPGQLAAPASPPLALGDFPGAPIKLSSDSDSVQQIHAVMDLQGPPSERTQMEKIRDLKSLARQYARDQGSCDDTRISYLEYVESEAEADWTLARMIAG
jgi:hypothetical protein